MSAVINHKSKYFETFLRKQNPKTQMWALVSKSGGDVIGYIQWYGPWRQYCFFPVENTIWSKLCLRDVDAVIVELMSTREYAGR